MHSYNGDGLRVKKLDRADSYQLTDHQYTWDPSAGSGQAVGAALPVILQETAGGQTAYYVYGLDLITSVQGSTATYYLTDGLGSTTELTSSAGSVTDTYLYDVFGALRSSSGTSTQPFRFTGEQQDPNVGGLYYLRARYYDPTQGRFLTRDPFSGLVGVPQSLNRYAYVLNNPVNWVDPRGLQPCPIDPGKCDVEIPAPSIPFFLPRPVQVPDIPLPRFNPGNPIEHAKEWWDWIRGSNANTSEPDFTPWTPSPREPGQILPPGFQPPTGGPGKWMWRAVLLAGGAYAVEQSGVLNMCRPPKE